MTGDPLSRSEAKALVGGARRLHDTATALLAAHELAMSAARTALDSVQAGLIATELDRIPVTRLKEVTEGRLRLGALEAAGYTTVGHVYRATRPALYQVNGVGAQTADQALAAAGQIAKAVEEILTVRLAVGDRDENTSGLVVALRTLIRAEPDLRRALSTAQRLASTLPALVHAARPATGFLRGLFAGRARRDASAAAVHELDRTLRNEAAQDTTLLLSQAHVHLVDAPAPAEAAWVDFEVRSAEYYSLIAEISGRKPDAQAAQGFLPGEVAARVNEQPLDEKYLRVSLRGYQSFGARFALVQRRVILGDEMGLGKTIQAIAALAHVAARGASHLLVVCPASVLVNWTREVQGRSQLRVVPMHGPDREAAFSDWRENGGVAITTFDVLHNFAPLAPGSVGMVVVDEAHYVKNPDTRRSKAVHAWLGSGGRVLFLTGTPMENRVAEFRNLVGYLQPGLLGSIEGSDAVAGSRAFRMAVAPAYLRRNQEDVLPELPDLIETDEWEEPSATDLSAYRAAVEAGNFMAMRRAAYAHPPHSAKLERLRELVAEAAANHLKVVVFSYFRDVLNTVHQALGAHVSGQISGNVPAARRQAIVDEFTTRPGHAVLLSQIQAGGVGLNMQAASVVVICEPQIKPTMEQQAIARAHRMGQVRPVQVHRLLTPGGVDERMLQLLGRKSRLFDSYARRSDVADSTPDAVDISEERLARQIVHEEQARLRNAGS